MRDKDYLIASTISSHEQREERRRRRRRRRSQATENDCLERIKAHDVDTPDFAALSALRLARILCYVTNISGRWTYREGGVLTANQRRLSAFIKIREQDMTANRVFYYLFIIVCTASSCAMSKKRDNPEQRDADAPVLDSSDRPVSGDLGDRGNGRDASEDNGSASSREGTSETDASGDAADAGGFKLRLDTCGNGIVESYEQCDDGNFEQDDGCTAICQFSCIDDADCDDLNDCNGVERCTDERVCDDSDPDLEEGAQCDPDKSCWRGVCVQNICGDAKRDRGEQCDDGNLDPDDGCTADCELTCEQDSDCIEKDECLGERRCRDDGQHGGLRVCVGGTLLENETACEIKDTKTKAFCGDPGSDKDGWCIGGVCTCAGCGDGEVNGEEQCDDGLLNGTAQSSNNCGKDCRVASCQNGVVEGEEECDDGNDRPMDGCDPECKYEFAHRFRNVQLLKDVEVPKWCQHPNNRFAEAFTDEVSVAGSTPINVLNIFSQQYNSLMASDDAFYVLHIIDSDDTSLKTVDEEIRIGLYRAYPYDDFGNPRDMPVLIGAHQLDKDTLLPAEYHAVQALQAGGGRVITSQSSVVELAGFDGASFFVHDFAMQVVFDMSGLSQPNAEPLTQRDTIQVSENLMIPEVSAQQPMGLLCGAIGPEFDNRRYIEPINDGTYAGTMLRCCKNNGDAIGTSYRYCLNEQSPDQCDSVGDRIHQGCSICLEANLDGGSFPLQAECATMLSDPSRCTTVIKGIDFDVDTDGDGVNDSWSVLLGFETQRVRVYNVSAQ